MYGVFDSTNMLKYKHKTMHCHHFIAQHYIQVLEMHFLQRVPGLSIRDVETSLIIQYSRGPGLLKESVEASVWNATQLSLCALLQKQRRFSLLRVLYVVM